MWYHFEFTSGSNPYICTSYESAVKLIKRYRRKHITVEKIIDGFYRVYDR